MRPYDYWNEMSYYKYLHITNHSRLRQETEVVEEEENVADEEEGIGDTE